MNTRHFIATILAFLASLVFWRKRQTGQFQAKLAAASKPVMPTVGYVLLHITLQKKRGAYQWRCGDEAMSRRFDSEVEATAFKGPFLTDQDCVNIAEARGWKKYPPERDGVGPYWMHKDSGAVVLSPSGFRALNLA